MIHRGCSHKDSNHKDVYSLIESSKTQCRNSGPTASMLVPALDLKTYSERDTTVTNGGGWKGKFLSLRNCIRKKKELMEESCSFDHIETNSGLCPRGICSMSQPCRREISPTRVTYWLKLTATIGHRNCRNSSHSSAFMGGDILS